MDKNVFLERLQKSNALHQFMQIDKVGSDFLVLRIPAVVDGEDGCKYGATANVPFDVFKNLKEPTEWIPVEWVVDYLVIKKAKLLL